MQDGPSSDAAFFRFFEHPAGFADVDDDKNDVVESCVLNLFGQSETLLYTVALVDGAQQLQRNDRHHRHHRDHPEAFQEHVGIRRYFRNPLDERQDESGRHRTGSHAARIKSDPDEQLRHSVGESEDDQIARNEIVPQLQPRDEYTHDRQEDGEPDSDGQESQHNTALYIPCFETPAAKAASPSPYGVRVEFLDNLPFAGHFCFEQLPR